MNVKLIAHTQLSQSFKQELLHTGFISDAGDEFNQGTDGQAVALTAIRTCYSPNKPSEIIEKEGAKYFGNKATDGQGGTEADRLIRMIFASKHTSTLEGISFNFAVEGVSRALLAQLTRHRVGFSFSVQSQRYVRMGSGDKIGGFDYVMPDSIKGDYAKEVKFECAMNNAQTFYDSLRELGVSAEDARSVLPNAAATNLVMTVNLRALLDFYAKRKAGRGAQSEITQLAERLREKVVAVEGWTDKFFEEV
ncbi:FAD-dependent thymidylate synthase [Listeria monocytogenes]|nr:FAD-dependent thymidylate synthase [Listeria monocytogenes]